MTHKCGCDSKHKDTNKVTHTHNCGEGSCGKAKKTATDNQWGK
ncbi:hypothetical protein JCM1393_01200 [Clostridium carnis]